MINEPTLQYIDSHATDDVAYLALHPSKDPQVDMQMVLTCIQISQEAGQVVWYSHLFKNFPEFIEIHTVKGFSVVSGADIYFSGTLLLFLIIQRMLAI